MEIESSPLPLPHDESMPPLEAVPDEEMPALEPIPPVPPPKTQSTYDLVCRLALEIHHESGMLHYEQHFTDDVAPRVVLVPNALKGDVFALGTMTTAHEALTAFTAIRRALDFVLHPNQPCPFYVRSRRDFHERMTRLFVTAGVKRDGTFLIHKQMDVETILSAMASLADDQSDGATNDAKNAEFAAKIERAAAVRAPDVNANDAVPLTTLTLEGDVGWESQLAEIKSRAVAIVTTPHFTAMRVAAAADVERAYAGAHADGAPPFHANAAGYMWCIWQVAVARLQIDVGGALKRINEDDKLLQYVRALEFCVAKGLTLFEAALAGSNDFETLAELAAAPTPRVDAKNDERGEAWRLTKCLRPTRAELAALDAGKRAELDAACAKERELFAEAESVRGQHRTNKRGGARREEAAIETEGTDDEKRTKSAPAATMETNTKVANAVEPEAQVEDGFEIL